MDGWILIRGRGFGTEGMILCMYICMSWRRSFFFGLFSGFFTVRLIMFLFFIFSCLILQILAPFSISSCA